MTPRARWWLGALVLTAELLIVGTHLDYAKAVYKAVYLTLWDALPKPDGAQPGRFAPR